MANQRWQKREKKINKHPIECSDAAPVISVKKISKYTQ